MKKKFSLPSVTRTYQRPSDNSSIVLNLEIKLPQMAAPVAQPSPVIPAEVIKQRLQEKAKDLVPLNKNSPKSKFNQDIYPEPVSVTPSETGKGVAPKPRPGYYH